MHTKMIGSLDAKIAWSLGLWWTVDCSNGPSTTIYTTTSEYVYHFIWAMRIAVFQICCKPFIRNEGLLIREDM